MSNEIEIPESNDRDAILRARWEQGLTLEEIGAELKVTRERIRQLYKPLGLPAAGRTQRRTNWLCQHHGDVIRTEFLQLRSDAEIASKLGFTAAEVKAVVNALVPDAGVLRRRPQRSQPRYDDRELTDSLMVAAAALPSPLAHDDYNAWAADNPMDDGRVRPSHQTMALRWGSWRAALKQAGLPTRPRLGPTSALSRQTVIAAVVACWKELGEAPTSTLYEAWAKSHGQGPSLASVRKFVDGWDDARVSAWEVVHNVKLPRTDLPELPASELDPEDEVEVRALFADSRVVLDPSADPRTERAGAPYREANEMIDPAPADLAIPDPEAIRDALRSHARLQNVLADAVTGAGLRPLSPSGSPFYDIAWRRRDRRLVLGEVKSAVHDTLEEQMRAAIAQALRYRVLAKHHLFEPVDACILSELEPDALWKQLCADLKIVVAWPSCVTRLVEGN